MITNLNILCKELFVPIKLTIFIGSSGDVFCFINKLSRFVAAISIMGAQIAAAVNARPSWNTTGRGSFRVGNFLDVPRHRVFSKALS